MNEIVLTWFEIVLAAGVGVRRRVEAIRRNSANSAGYDPAKHENPWVVDIEGACAEMAFAKFKQCYWNASIDTYKKEADISDGIEVRSTRQEGGSLIIRDADDDNRTFVLVIGHAPRYRMAGFIRGGEGKQAAWIRNPNSRSPAYFVPQRALMPISELSELNKIFYGQE